MHKHKTVPRNIEHRDCEREEKRKLNQESNEQSNNEALRRETKFNWWLRCDELLFTLQKGSQRINVLWLLNNHFEPIGIDHHKWKSRKISSIVELLNVKTTWQSLNENLVFKRTIELHANGLHFILSELHTLRKTFWAETCFHCRNRYFDARQLHELRCQVVRRVKLAIEHQNVIDLFSSFL